MPQETSGNLSSPENVYLRAGKNEEKEMEVRNIDETFYALDRFYTPKKGAGGKIEMDDFKGIIPQEIMQEHEEDIFNKKADPGYRDATLLGKFVENVLAREGERFPIFGENTCTILASEYDDLFNGADVIVEVKNGDDIARFTIDVTTGNAETVLGKSARQNKNLQQGKLGTLTYFQSEYDESVVGLKNVPHLILEVDPEGVYQFLSRVKPFVDERTQQVKDKKNYEKYVFIFLRDAKKNLLENLRVQIGFLLECGIKHKILAREDEERARTFFDEGEYDELLKLLQESKTNDPSKKQFSSSITSLLSLKKTLTRDSQKSEEKIPSIH